MATVTKERPTLLERQQAQLEKLNTEAGVLEVEIARLKDKTRALREETARTSPSRLASLVRVGGPVAQNDREISKKEARLRNIREEASALGVAIIESQTQRVAERTEAYRARQSEIHERELEVWKEMGEAFGRLAELYMDSYLPIVAEVSNLQREAQAEGLRNPPNEREWARLSEPAIKKVPKNFEGLLVRMIDITADPNGMGHRRLGGTLVDLLPDFSRQWGTRKWR